MFSDKKRSITLSVIGLVARSQSTRICGFETIGRSVLPYDFTFKGNGHPSEWKDSGQSVFLNDDSTVASCGDFQVPACVEEALSCDSSVNMYSDLLKVTDAQYLTEALSVDLSISVSTGSLWWESSTTKTKSFEEDAEFLQSEDRMIYIAGGLASTWSGSCTLLSKTNLASQFEEGLNTILEAVNKGSSLEAHAQADKVIATYGPAVIVGMRGGSAFVSTYGFNETAYAEYHSLATSSESGIQENALFYGYDVNTNGYVETEDAKLCDIYYSQRSSYSIGVSPVYGESYVKTVGDDCVAVGLDLMSLDDFVRQKGVPGFSETENYVVVDQLTKAIRRQYCSVTSSCNTPSPVPELELSWTQVGSGVCEPSNDLTYAVESAEYTILGGGVHHTIDGCGSCSVTSYASATIPLDKQTFYGWTKDHCGHDCLAEVHLDIMMLHDPNNMFDVVVDTYTCDSSDSCSVKLRDGYLLVGGGAYAMNGGYMLSKSLPFNTTTGDLEIDEIPNGWCGAAADAHNSVGSGMMINVVGIRLADSSDDIALETSYTHNVMSSSAGTRVYAAVESGFTLVGGGAHGGNLKISNLYPYSEESWTATIHNACESSYVNDLRAVAIGLKLTSTSSS